MIKRNHEVGCKRIPVRPVGRLLKLLTRPVFWNGNKIFLSQLTPDRTVGILSFYQTPIDSLSANPHARFQNEQKTANTGR